MEKGNEWKDGSIVEDLNLGTCCVTRRGKNAIGFKWVYTIKLKAYGSLDRYMARLVVKWYAQKYGIDYQDTFAHVAKLNTIHILIWSYSLLWTKIGLYNNST